MSQTVITFDGEQQVVGPEAVNYGVLSFDGDPQTVGVAVDPVDYGVILIDGEQQVVAVEGDTTLFGIETTDYHLVTIDGVTTVSVLGTAEQETLLIESGPPGPTGPQGPAGQDGEDGMDAGVYRTYGFATPSTLWPINHDLGTYGIVVELVDQNGEVLEGNVRYVNVNTIEVDWYYPTAGEARLFT